MATKTKDQGGVPPGGLMSWMKKLNPRRQELIRPVLENPREFVLLSVRAAAARLSTDPATMVRIVQRMGFVNYRSFQNYLRDLSIANATSFEGMQAGAKATAEIPDYLNATVEQDVRNVNSVRTKLDAKRLAAVAKRIHGARRRLILGGDLAENLVHYLEHHLAIIGLPAFAATTVGRSLHVTRTMGKGDVVIAISFRKGLRQTVEAWSAPAAMAPTASGSLAPTSRRSPGSRMSSSSRCRKQLLHRLLCCAHGAGKPDPGRLRKLRPRIQFEPASRSCQ